MIINPFEIVDCVLSLGDSTQTTNDRAVPKGRVDTKLWHRALLSPKVTYNLESQLTKLYSHMVRMLVGTLVTDALQLIRKIQIETR